MVDKKLTWITLYLIDWVCFQLDGLITVAFWNGAKMFAQVLRRLRGFLSYPLYVVENLVQLVGPLFVAVVWTLISGIVWGWWAILRPYLWEKGHIIAVCHGIFAHWLLLNIVFHYYKGTTLHPGEPPQVSPETYERGIELNYKHCTRCKNLKPERAHHCIICRTCVLNMDHHCPWLNTCVGHFNHRHFFLFMWYIWLGCVYVASVSHEPFMARKTIRAQLRRENRLGEYKMELARQGIPEQSSQLSFCFVLTCAVTFALGILIIWHIYLISSSQTTIEFYSNALKRRRAREHGDVSMCNVSKLFGRSHLFVRNFPWMFSLRSNIELVIPSSSPPYRRGKTHTILDSSTIGTTFSGLKKAIGSRGFVFCSRLNTSQTAMACIGSI